MPTVQFSASSLNNSGTATLGELGTLYFTNTLLIAETISHNGQLVIPGFTNWSATNLTLSSAWIRFPDAFTLTVATNLWLTGSKPAS